MGGRHHHNKHSDIMQIFPGIQVPTKKSLENYRKHVFSRKKKIISSLLQTTTAACGAPKKQKNPKETTNGPLLDEGPAPRACCATGTPAVFFWFRANVGNDSGKCHLDMFALISGKMVAFQKVSKDVPIFRCKRQTMWSQLYWCHQSMLRRMTLGLGSSPQAVNLP